MDLSYILAFMSPLIDGGFHAVVALVYGLLPDADSAVSTQIRAWAYIFSGHDLDFNLYYFVDMNLIVVFLGIWLAVTLAGLLIMAVRFVLDIVHKVADSIPIIG